jgi:hypothetical protein
MTPGVGGTITERERINLPSALACIGPAPPNATSPKFRGSCPRSTLTTLKAACMFSFTMSISPRPPPPPHPDCFGHLSYGRLRSLLVELQRTAEGDARRDAMQDHVGVGHRRLLAAAP